MKLLWDDGLAVTDPNAILVGTVPTETTFAPYPPPPTGTAIVPSTPQILPTIDVTVPGGTLLDITPNVIMTETRLASVPWWLWALGAIGVYFALSGKAGRRRMSW